MIPHIYLSFISLLIIVVYAILLYRHPSLHLKGILNKKVDNIQIENLSATVKDFMFYKNGRLIGHYRIDIEYEAVLDVERHLILTDMEPTELINHYNEFKKEEMFFNRMEKLKTL